MAGPFRIARARVVKATGARDAEMQSYLDRLMRMIPAEVIGLYLVGSGMIAADAAATLAGWTVICALGVVAFRGWGSRDPSSATHPGPDWALVVISTIAFGIWIFNIGGPFTAYGIPNRPWGSLGVLAWTFFVPIFYKGV